MTMKELVTMSMNEIQDYMLTMNFKKRVIGGVDEEDVLEHIKAICGIAREEMEKQFESYETSLEKGQEEVKYLKLQLENLNLQLEKYQSTNQQMQLEKDQLKMRTQNMQAEAKKYKEARERLEQEEKSHREARQGLLGALDALQYLREEVEKAVREEMREELFAEEENERSRMLEKIEGECVAAEQRLKHLNSEIAAVEKKNQSMEENLQQKREQWKKHLTFVSGLFGEDGEKELPPTN